MQSLLTAEQLAPLLGVGIEQVRKLTREGSLPHHRIGGAIRYDLESVKASTLAGDGATKARGVEALIEQYFNMVLKYWDLEGEEGNKYKVAHFDGFMAALREWGLIDHAPCESWRRKLRAVTGSTV